MNPTSIHAEKLPELKDITGPLEILLPLDPPV
jgi:hypothetical protein